jgi:hypothetical protein
MSAPGVVQHLLYSNTGTESGCTSMLLGILELPLESKIVCDDPEIIGRSLPQHSTSRSTLAPTHDGAQCTVSAGIDSGLSTYVMVWELFLLLHTRTLKVRGKSNSYMWTKDQDHISATSFLANASPVSDYSGPESNNTHRCWLPGARGDPRTDPGLGKAAVAVTAQTPNRWTWLKFGSKN